MTTLGSVVLAAVTGIHDVEVGALAAVLPAAARDALGLPATVVAAPPAERGGLEPHLLDDLATAQVVHLVETDAHGSRRCGLVLGGATLLVVHGLHRLHGPSASGRHARSGGPRIDVGQGPSERSGDLGSAGGLGEGVADADAAADVSRHDEAAAPAAPLTLRVEAVPASALALVLGRFAGLHPTGVLAGAQARVSDADLARRLADPQTPPPAGAPAWLTAVWARPWRLWSIEGDALERLDHIDTGEGGQLAVRPTPEGDLLVTIRPDGLVWGDLQRVPLALAAARGEVDPDASDW